MSISITPTKHLVRVYELLLRTYGEPKNEPDYDPLGGLVGTVLSQHTSDINSDRAYKQLVATFPTWEDVRDAPMYLIAEAIRSGGLANIKARRIQDVLLLLTELQQEQGGRKSLSDYFYDELTRRTSEDAWHFLRSMPGVGPKTAACVLMFNLNRSVMPVDMHVYRTNNWLGFIQSVFDHVQCVFDSLYVDNCRLCCMFRSEHGNVIATIRGDSLVLALNKKSVHEYLRGGL
jgi:endonuclease III